mmetsp:Transcript_6040/g.11453  ORF Transcript_6040/g.11453 Transcript_6040/m.11453 type:complete len:444 (+) Transcript_6040:146-1477(+)
MTISTTTDTTSPIIAVKEGRHVKNCLFFSYHDALEHISDYPSAKWKVFASDDISNAISFCRREHLDNGGPSFPPHTQSVVANNKHLASVGVTPAIGTEEDDHHKEQSKSPLSHDHDDGDKCSSSSPSSTVVSSLAVPSPAVGAQTVPLTESPNQLGFDFEKDDEKQKKVTNSKVSQKATSQKAKKNQSDIQWEDMFESLKKYKHEHGTSDIKKDPENVALYNWVQAQRLEYKKLANGNDCKLSAMKIQKLIDLGFSFSKRAKYYKWNERIEQLKQFKIKHGHLKIPISDPELGEFASKQRSEYAKYMKGRKDTAMTAEKEKQLRELGFVFLNGKRISEEKKSKPKRTWEERYQELLVFKEQHGHTIVPQHSESGLGQWVHEQRKSYKKMKAGKQCALTTEKVLKLSDVGFVFDASSQWKSRKNAETTEFDDDDKHLFSHIDDF